jgi:endonuclease YncB( thermonuclease family)
MGPLRFRWHSGLSGKLQVGCLTFMALFFACGYLAALLPAPQADTEVGQVVQVAAIQDNSSAVGSVRVSMKVPTSTALATIEPIPAPPIQAPDPVQPTVAGAPTSTVSPPESNGGASQGELVRGRVRYVIDGDTIEVEVGGTPMTVRYIGIDTPERGDPFAAEATDANRELIGGKVVALEKDVSETDKYGRLLRYVYVGDTFVNAELVRQGYAQVTNLPPDVAHAEKLLEIERQAQAAGAGLWAFQEPRVSDFQADAVVLASSLNVRAGPGTDYAVVGTVSEGDGLTVNGRNAETTWLVISGPAGARGWASARYVQPNINLAEKPVTAAPAQPEPTQQAPTQQPPAQEQQAVCNCTGNVYNCSDFGTHSAAQACYEYCQSVGRGDIHWLDGDNDGSACERLP